MAQILSKKKYFQVLLSESFEIVRNVYPLCIPSKKHHHKFEGIISKFLGVFADNPVIGLTLCLFICHFLYTGKGTVTFNHIFIIKAGLLIQGRRTCYFLHHQREVLKSYTSNEFSVQLISFFSDKPPFLLSESVLCWQGVPRAFRGGSEGVPRALPH
jgi:hypothetical protein